MATIIGTSAGGYLVEMTGSELAKIMGPGYEHLMREKFGERWNAVGTQINISPLWAKLDRLSNHQKTFTGIAKEMRKTAEWLDTIPRVIQTAAEEENK